MYADSFEMDYTEIDQQMAEARQWLRDELPWLTPAELGKLCELDTFPGLLADYADLASFVFKVKQGKSRMVACKVQQAGYTVSARVDLVSGLVYWCENGRYKEADLTGWLMIEMPSSAVGRPWLKHTVSNQVRHGRMTLMSPNEMQSLVVSLEKAKLLASL